MTTGAAAPNDGGAGVRYYLTSSAAKAVVKRAPRWRLLRVKVSGNTSGVFARSKSARSISTKAGLFFASARAQCVVSSELTYPSLRATFDTTAISLLSRALPSKKPQVHLCDEQGSDCGQHCNDNSGLFPVRAESDLARVPVFDAVVDAPDDEGCWEADADPESEAVGGEPYGESSADTGGECVGDAEVFVVFHG